MQAIYTGTFDPFTNGHLDIIKQASKLFKDITIVIAKNSNKNKRQFDIYEMQNAISKALVQASIQHNKVIVYDGLIADYCKNHNIKYIVRGLRNNTDYDYEENIAKINKELNPDVNTIYFRAEHDALSSSFVRELLQYHCNVEKYVPPEINKLITKSMEV